MQNTTEGLKICYFLFSLFVARIIKSEHPEKEEKIVKYYSNCNCIIIVL